MNFEERKAEIFRRGEAKIAERRRKRRIALSIGLPIGMLAVLILPISQISGQLRSEEKGQAPMNAAPSDECHMSVTRPELIIVGEDFPDMVPPEAVPAEPPETSFEKELTAPTLDSEMPGSEDPYDSQPPKITVGTEEGATDYPPLVRQSWPKWVDGELVYVVSKELNLLSPGVVDVSVTTGSDILSLDAIMSAPEDVSAECWPASDITDAYRPSLPPSQGVTVIQNNSAPTLFHIQLKPGSYIYQVHIKWPCGSAAYAFIATVE